MVGLGLWKENKELNGFSLSSGEEEIFWRWVVTHQHTKALDSNGHYT